MKKAPVKVPTESTAAEDMAWYIDGAKGLHEGFFKALYKTGHVTTDDKCLDQKTVDNLSVYSELLADPFSIFTHFDLEKDIGYFSDAAEIFEDLAACKWEAPAVDLIKFCGKDDKICSIKTLGDNLTKNMFVLVGKLTSIAETL